jgi:hypothetical protein
MGSRILPSVDPGTLAATRVRIVDYYPPLRKKMDFLFYSVPPTMLACRVRYGMENPYAVFINMLI